MRKLLTLTLIIAAGLLTLAACSATQATSAPGPALPLPRPAAIARPPTVTFSFTQRSVTSGAQPELRYASRNLPAGSRVFLQLELGTPPQWTYVQTLNGAAGAEALAALPAGVYTFRLAVVRGVVVATSPSQLLSVVTPPSSSCTACQILSGVGGAIFAWIISWLP